MSTIDGNDSDLKALERALKWQASGGATKAAEYHAKRRGQYGPSPRVTVDLSVRHSWGGHCFCFTYVEKTISTLQAECEARKSARAQGYIVQCTIQVTEEN